MLGYGFATFLYRILILYSLIFTMIPEHFRFGFVLAAWGAYAMFPSLLIEDNRKVPKANEVKPARRWISRLVMAMTPIVSLRNPRFDHELVLLALEQAKAELLVATTAGVDAA